eukprot:TRINITY_DN1993_c0_g2_i1.p1 TRINITY_DN1993_c0_g2~~TRINITY_DN1993_c0_g2_i1.p1  ORF type:complete len:253 (-),score=49.77 TRINITY_DN1993_c0_g2_i1:34-738(-)
MDSSTLPSLYVTGPPSPLKNVCVYSGASRSCREIYHSFAEQLGCLIAQRGKGLVYGGGNTGLMGATARGALAAGGKVIGIIPSALMSKEISGESLGCELRVVKDMHERKAAMAEEADAFIALPGGYGTLEELLEMITWAQLGIHTKPVGVLNVNGYFDFLLAFFDHAVTEGFVSIEARSILIASASSEHLLNMLEEYVPSHKQMARRDAWEMRCLGYESSNKHPHQGSSNSSSS